MGNQRRVHGDQFFFVNRQTNLFIMLRFAAFAALVAVAVALPAGPPAYGPPPPAYAPAPYHPAPHGKPIDEAPKPYAFQYGVSDDYSGAKFNAQETADGKVVTGQYQVALPDGRIQTVTYTTTTVMSLMSNTKVSPSTQRPNLTTPPPSPDITLKKLSKTEVANNYL